MTPFVRALVSGLMLAACGCDSEQVPAPSDGAVGRKPDMTAFATCSDNSVNGGESDVDCGGRDCPACAAGRRCGVDGDCQSGLCIAGTCRAGATCNDTRKDGVETDVDCGGGTCPRCAEGAACTANDDCESQLCRGMRCSKPTPLKMSFANPVEYDLGSSFNAIVAGDVDGDNKLDLALPYRGDMFLLKGNGDGSFLPAKRFATGVSGVVVAAAGADFNGDGRIDVALLEVSSQVRIVIGEAAGFAAGPVLALLKSGRGLATGDFNGDAVIDLATSDSILLGVGNGTFMLAKPAGASFDPSNSTVGRLLAAGKFNRDAMSDLANPTTAFVSGKDGAFMQSDSLRKDMENANSVAVADINGDESADLLYQTTGNRRELSVHLSRADGTFAPVTKTPFRSSDAALAVADFDGDGWPDIASYDPANAAVMGFLGKGTGAVGQTFSISCGQKDDQPGLMSAPDLNGDGLPDLVFSVGRYVMNVQVARILVLINTSR